MEHLSFCSYFSAEKFSYIYILQFVRIVVWFLLIILTAAPHNPTSGHSFSSMSKLHPLCVAPFVLLNIRDVNVFRVFSFLVVGVRFHYFCPSFRFFGFLCWCFFPQYVLTFFASPQFFSFHRATRMGFVKMNNHASTNEMDGAFPAFVCTRFKSSGGWWCFWVDSNYYNTIGINFKMFRSKKYEIVGDLLTKADT